MRRKEEGMRERSRFERFADAIDAAFDVVYRPAVLVLLSFIAARLSS